MARIPEDEVERLKREVSVERLAEARGIKLKRLGADLHGLCPFHDDQTPSLVITPAKNLWHCMGACAAGGTAIDWVMRANGVSFRHAVELLRRDHLPLAASSSAPVKKSTVPKLPAPVTAEAGEGSLPLGGSSGEGVPGRGGSRGERPWRGSAVESLSAKRPLSGRDLLPLPFFS